MLERVETGGQMLMSRCRCLPLEATREIKRPSAESPRYTTEKEGALQCPDPARAPHVDRCSCRVSCDRMELPNPHELA